MCFYLASNYHCPVQYQQNEPLTTEIAHKWFNLGENILGLLHRINRKPSLSQNTIYESYIFDPKAARKMIFMSIVVGWCEDQGARLWWLWSGVIRLALQQNPRWCPRWLPRWLPKHAIAHYFGFYSIVLQSLNETYASLLIYIYRRSV